MPHPLWPVPGTSSLENESCFTPFFPRHRDRTVCCGVSRFFLQGGRHGHGRPRQRGARWSYHLVLAGTAKILHNTVRLCALPTVSLFDLPPLGFTCTYRHNRIIKSINASVDVEFGDSIPVKIYQLLRYVYHPTIIFVFLCARSNACAAYDRAMVDNIEHTFVAIHPWVP